jgi:NDP-sugar pyrophosphorylase family protein
VKKVEAVILCAKKKESLFPFSETKPTGLIPIVGKPIVEHLINSLEEAGISKIHLVTNYKEEMFEAEFSDQKNIDIVHQEELTGTADAVESCDFVEDNFLVINGDVTVSSRDLTNIIEKQEKTDAKAVMLATDQNKPEKFGVLSIEDDKVVEIEEKPEEAENSLINTGIYAFSPEIFESIKDSESSDLTEAIKGFVSNEEARFDLVEDYWSDIGSPEKLWKADQQLRDSMITETAVHEDAEVADSVEINGSAIIEPEAEIGPNVTLEGNCYIGENVHLKPGTVVEDSTVTQGSILSDCNISETLVFEENIIDPQVAVERTILGEETDIKSGTVIRESFIGARSFVDMNNSIRGIKFVPDARTDLSEISK